MGWGSDRLARKRAGNAANCNGRSELDVVLRVRRRLRACVDVFCRELAWSGMSTLETAITIYVLDKNLEL